MTRRDSRTIRRCRAEIAALMIEIAVWRCLDRIEQCALAAAAAAGRRRKRDAGSTFSQPDKPFMP